MLPSLNVTVPVAFVPVFPPTRETVALNDTASPAVIVIVTIERERPVVLLALVTVSVSGLPVLSLGLKLLSPLYFATTVCMPAVRLGLARLLLLKIAVPLVGSSVPLSISVPSMKNVTTPLGVPPLPATFTLKNS